MNDKRIIVGIAGNSDVGKSAIFNSLTSSRQHVGNWPGKTIERAEGVFYHEGWQIHLLDLPGTYSLAAQSLEEMLARDYILSGEPDMVVNVVDATNLERNLNLILQILELTDKVVVALNLIDEVKRQGWVIDVQALEATLGLPVVPTVATEGEGLSELANTLVEIAEGNWKTHPVLLDHGVTVEEYLKKQEGHLAVVGIEQHGHWLALRLLEDNPEIVSAFKAGHLPDCCRPINSAPVSSQALRTALRSADRLRESIHPDARIEIVQCRYELADNIVHRTVNRLRPEEESLTEKVDRIVAHRLWSWPIMLAMLSVVLWITIQGANVSSDMLGFFFDWLAKISRSLLVQVSALWWIVGSLVDGPIVGTGTVIAVMLPPMIIFFTAFNLLEDIGFIPRIAFNLDRLMRAVGSQGKHTMVALMCFGCN